MDKKVSKWLWNETKAQHGRILILIAGDVCISLLSVFFALLTKDVIDAAVSNQSGFVKYAALLITTVLTQYVLHAILLYLGEMSVTSITADLRGKIADDLMGGDYEKARQLHSGEWLNRMFSDIKIVASGCTGIIPGAVGMSVRLLTAGTALLYLEPLFSAIYIVIAALMIIVISFMRRTMKKMHKNAQKKEDTVHSFMQEILDNLLVIKTFRARDYIREKTQEYHDEWRTASLKKRAVSIAANTSFGLTFRLGYVLALVYGCRSLMAGLTTYGTIMAVLQLVNQIQTPVARLSGVLTRVYEVGASCERIMEAEQNTVKKQKTESIGAFRSLIFDHVSFQYDRNPVLEDISFQINRGEITAFTGISGGGKSTLFLLAMGIYEPIDGEIKIITEKGVFSVSEITDGLFAYVPQENLLFTGTIRENVCFNSQFDKKKLAEALHIACADTFVVELPQKEKTVIQDGTGLSEGQMQRIAIARAVYSGAPIILLDESTSALDEETEKSVLRNIQSLSEQTVLIVTHRPAALSVCDHHIRLKNGRLV